MAASDAVGIIIGSGIAVAGGFVTQWFITRHDTKRFESERENQRQARFLDIKRELYARLNRVIRDIIGQIYLPIHDPDVLRKMPKVRPDYDELDTVQNTLDVICEDELATKIEMAINRLMAVLSITKNEELSNAQLQQEADTARDLWTDVYKLMKQDLAGTYIPPKVARKTGQTWRGTMGTFPQE